VLTFSDVTRLKNAAEQAELLAAVLMNSEDAVMVFDLDGRITAWNGGAERLYGYSAAEARRLTIMQLTPPDRRPEKQGIWDRLRRGERVESWETHRIAK